MSTRRWAHLLSTARAARSQHWPVTVLLGYRDKIARVTDRDRLMALALQHYEDSCCPDCGQPSWLGYGVENVERAEFKTDVCHWCESAGTARRNLAKEHKDGVPDGWLLHAVDTLDPSYTPT